MVLTLTLLDNNVSKTKCFFLRPKLCFETFPDNLLFPQINKIGSAYMYLMSFPGIFH